MSHGTSKSNRLCWTTEVKVVSSQEELFIKELIEEKQISNWQIISAAVTAKFNNLTRTAKQCRERYTNYIKFEGKSPKIAQWRE